jgi:hypothetical protein
VINIIEKTKVLVEISFEELFAGEITQENDWFYISNYCKLTEDMIREFKNQVDWWYICMRQTLSESFIEEFADKVDWFCISKYQKLSESFMQKYKDKIDWDCISRYQLMGKTFITEHKKLILFANLTLNKKIPYSIKADLFNNIDYEGETNVT